MAKKHLPLVCVSIAVEYPKRQKSYIFKRSDSIFSKQVYLKYLVVCVCLCVHVASIVCTFVETLSLSEIEEEKEEEQEGRNEEERGRICKYNTIITTAAAAAVVLRRSWLWLPYF